MIRVKSSSQTHSRHTKILQMAKGYRGRARTCFRVGVEKVEKALQYSYADRRTKKRTLRTIWVQRINAGCFSYNTSYSKTLYNLHQGGILLNKKILSELAITEPYTFHAIVSLQNKDVKYPN